MTQTFNDQLATLDAAAKLQEQTETAIKRVSRCRTKLLLGKDAKAAFFASIAMRMELISKHEVPPARGRAIVTMATDGKRLIFDPSWIATLSDPELMCVIVHECLHVSNAHHARRGHRDKGLFNVACDCAINSILKECGYTLPACAVIPGANDPRFKELPQGLCAEEYYARLLEKMPPKPPPPPTTDEPIGPDALPGLRGPGRPGDEDEFDLDPGGCGGVIDPGEGSPSECAQAEAEAEMMTAQAEQAAKQAEMSGRGTLPASLRRSIDQALAPKVDWRDVLREFVSRTAKNDYSWQTPNRRFVSQGIYLPGMRSDELGHVVLAVDTSGSIGQEQLDRFGSEVQAILETYDCELTIIYCDAQVNRVDEWKSSDGPLKLTPCGGGGTSHIPVFDHIEEHQLDPVCLVCLTDLYTEFPKHAPEYPVLWAVESNPTGKAPWGQTLHIPKGG
jgi:predicted metal-dependent peptidase